MIVKMKHVSEATKIWKKRKMPKTLSLSIDTIERLERMGINVSEFAEKAIRKELDKVRG